MQKAQGPGLCKLPKPPASRALCHPDPSSKATLWVKAQHEGALPPPCIARKDPRCTYTMTTSERLRLRLPDTRSGWPDLQELPGGSAGKESACHVGDLGSIPGGGHGNPLQYSCLENSMEEPGVHGVSKSRTRPSNFPFTFHFMRWRRKWQPTPVFLPGESQGRGSLVGCCLWGRTESGMGSLFPSLGHLSNTGIEPRSPTWQADSLPAEPQGNPKSTGVLAYPFSRGSSQPRDQT